MKLFYTKGTCALAPHIVMAELNMVYELEAVDIRNKTYAGGNFREINPKGSVPVLKLESGEYLTEGAVIMQYLADQKPESMLLPKLGTLERYRCQEWLNFVATELHKNFTPLFVPQLFAKTEAAQTEMKDGFRNMLKYKIEFLSQKLGNNDYLMGSNFTVADAYLFNVLSWSKLVNLDLSQWSNITSFLTRVGSRPAVIRAMKEQGML